ncbi:CoA transferase [Acuticoccus sediminis]|uniref:CoA transferase n=1 Tax=Acuticoccus sediminis TaxID=2184697 RepID=A0A8B2NKA4_9HYPH|nr:CoA transferase [Acuticoccus sediminis]RAH97781.1 CoA transferase [Acuticoccus sediminis]
MKLEGVRVLDLSMFLPGPYLTTLMADHGAEIIKVEPPSGEPARGLGYRSEDGVSVWYRNTHRGKRSVVLDLKTEAGREALMTLVDTADVFIEAFRPGVVDRLGVGPDAVTARNPRIVYASISAFGQVGPEAKRPGHDLAIEALAGIVSLNLGADGEPTNPHMPVADLSGSLMTLVAVLMALLRRETTGRGDVIDMSMQDAAMSFLPNVVGPVFAENRAPRVKEERSFGGYAFFSIYRTSDGRHVALGGVEHKFAANLLNALGRPDLIGIAAGPPGPPQQPVKDFLAETFATKTRDEWEAWFESLDVCFAPVLDLKEAFDRPQVALREMKVRTEDGALHIGTPIKFRDEPGRIDPGLAALGEHTETVLRGAGVPEATIAACLKRIP